MNMNTVFITGARRGLGLELVRQYAAADWRVLACSRNSSPALEELARRHRLVELVPLDVMNHDQIDKVAGSLRNEAIDVLINNAGVMGRVAFEAGGAETQSFGKMDYEDWEKTLRVNVMGPMKIAESFVEQVARSDQKKLITMTSMLGSMSLNTTGGLYGYRSSKAAVNAIMKSMSIDLWRRKILAVAMHPGWVRTDMGGSRADIDAETSVAGIRAVIASLSGDHLGKVLAFDGSVLPY
jgi:NAD(P)-dependent dehydrogenase (short-subunit alcohol dehydrogenase family)